MLLTTLLAALAIGAFTYAIIRVALLTFNYLKKFIVDKMKKNPPGIKEEALVGIREVLDQAPEISLEDFGPNMQMDDFLVAGIKSDGSLDENLDIIRAEQIEDDIRVTMKKAGGAIKIAG